MIIDTNIPDNPLLAKNVIPYGVQLAKNVIMTDIAGSTGTINIGDTITHSGGATGQVMDVDDASDPEVLLVQQTGENELTTGNYTGPSGTGIVQTIETIPLSKLEARARLYVETGIGTGIYEFVTEHKGYPDAQGWVFFHFHGILDDNPLQYSLPDLVDANKKDPNVCRNIKVEFYEYYAPHNTLLFEAYHEESAGKLIQTPPRTANYAYRFVIHSTDQNEVAEVHIANSDDSLQIALISAGYLNDVQGHVTHKKHLGHSSPSTYSHVYVPPGVKVQIYNYPDFYVDDHPNTVYSVSAARFALKGGLDIIRGTYGNDIYLGTPDGQFLLTPDGQKILFI